MSKNEWEGGTLKLPTAAWKPFRDGLAKAYNAQQTRRYELALKVHAWLMGEKAKAPRGAFVFRTAYLALTNGGSGLAQDLRKAEFLDEYALDGVLFSKGKNGLILPKKKDFPLAVATKTESYLVDEGQASIRLVPKTRQVVWHVSENNHAVDSAWESPLGKAFYALLSKVTWTRGTGGEFIGNDEYNEDNRDEGGGANYVTHRFGLKTAAEKASVTRFARESFRYR